jgi:hypothetical protein
MTATSSRDPTVRWLLTGDVSIRWQVLRDLLKKPRPEWEAEQAKVTGQGWAARILAYHLYRSHRTGAVANPDGNTIFFDQHV